MMKTKRIVGLFGFDMESDVGSWTTEYKGLRHGTPKILKILKKYDVNATFFFTGKAAEVSPVIVRLVKENGCEIGCHTLFHETVGDDIFPIPFMNPIMKAEVKERLRAATETIKKISGVWPVSFRSPRLFCSTEVINSLEELGYLVDASYPLYYFRKQLFPYHPSKKIGLKRGILRYLRYQILLI
jgi:peptidoglycan/xylan/chitin deacetylase (PgdA/CDA1 family)